MPEVGLVLGVNPNSMSSMAISGTLGPRPLVPRAFPAAAGVVVGEKVWGQGPSPHTRTLGCGTHPYWVGGLTPLWPYLHGTVVCWCDVACSGVLWRAVA